jgi:polyferredoxin
MKKEKKLNINKKELIVTIIVLALSVIIGFLVGKELFEAYYGKI